MMNDRERNHAYREAIETAVRPGDLVLDIGTGAGVTALMAARAGGYVVTCESNPHTAFLADRVIRANGYGDRITLIPRSSTELVVGRDLPRQPDVVTAEIFDCGLVGESALRSLDHAHRELISATTRFVPRGGRLWAQLVESESLHGLNQVGVVEGFDLSPFNVASTRGYFPGRISCHPHTVLSPAFRLLDFDFGEPPAPRTRHLMVPVTTDGIAHAVVMWFELDLGNGNRVSNHSAGSSHWEQAVQTFPTPVAVRAGTAVRLTTRHDLDALRLDLEGTRP
ncbi:50S ribosomal protein L11 methyltransferase [Streptomyces sp. NPDC054932]